MGTGTYEIEVERAFIGAGCSRIVNNVSFGACGLVAFGTQNAVAVFCPKSARILTTLPGHKAFVNCTLWLPSPKDVTRVDDMEEHFLLSGSTDGAIMLWGLCLKKWKWRHVAEVPECHAKGVTCITGIILHQGVALFASTASDGHVFIWEISLPSSTGGSCEITSVDSIYVGSKPMVSLSLAQLPTKPKSWIIAMGGLDNKIYLYSGGKKEKFVRACELKGPTDWIRSLDFSFPIPCDSGDEFVFLASSSQDKAVQIWKLSLLRSLLDNHVPQIKKGVSLTSYIEGPIFSVAGCTYQFSLESLLLGHDDWVYSIEWQPPIRTTDEDKKWHRPMSILSASMDKTMMIWRPEKTSGIWTNVVTVGELNHTALGFSGGHWGQDGDMILAHGYGGSFHLWKNVGLQNERWHPKAVPSGHSSSVTDFAWGHNGSYILSVSHDQTTRVFAPWESGSLAEENSSWHEIARPQVHGHDLNCVTIIHGGGNHRFVSGAEEKVARVFGAPLSFLKTLSNIVGQIAGYLEDVSDDIQILGANMSALGLSQKPIYAHAKHHEVNESTQDGIDSMETIPDATPAVLTEPPIEEQLAWHTLWPESHKLYGHGNELFSLCCNHAGKLLASSCKAQSAAVAEIWLWEVGTWKPLGQLHSHNLTVTRMEFSSDDSFLLSVSRDRHFSVFSIEGDGTRHGLVSKVEAHKRIIWDCSWNPLGHEFATGSRDKTVKIWGVVGMPQEASVKQLMVLPMFFTSVTALSWSKSGLLAIGMDDGHMELWRMNLKSDISSTAANRKFSSVPLLQLDPFLCHTATVQRLAWRNVSEESADTRVLQLASCGADHTVRVFNVKLS